MENYYIIEVEGSLPFTLITDYKRLNYKKVLPIVEDFMQIDRKYIKKIERTDKEEAMKNPLIRVMKDEK